MAKRSSLFVAPPSLPRSEAETPFSPSEAVAAVTEPAARHKPQDRAEASLESVRRYPVAKTRQGKRVATVYLEREALRQLQKLAFDEETTLQALLVEGVNAVFAARGLSRIA